LSIRARPMSCAAVSLVAAAYQSRVRANPEATPTSSPWLTTVTLSPELLPGLDGFQVSGAPLHDISDGTWKVPLGLTVVLAMAHGTQRSRMVFARWSPVT